MTVDSLRGDDVASLIDCYLDRYSATSACSARFRGIIWFGEAKGFAIQHAARDGCSLSRLRRRTAFAGLCFRRRLGSLFVFFSLVSVLFFRRPGLSPAFR